MFFYTQHPWHETCQGSTGRMASTFFLVQKEPAIAPNSETFSPLINPGSRVSLLMSLHVMADEGRDGDGFQVTELAEEWKMGCPESPKWEGEGEAWSEHESLFSTASHKGNMCNDALHVIGLHGSGDKISFFFSLSACRTGSWQRWH